MRKVGAWLSGAAAVIGVAGACGPLAASETTTYTYDALGRLISSSIAGGPNAAKMTATCFDAAGNRLRYVTGSGAPPACSTTPTPSPTPSATLTAVADSASLPCHTGLSVDVISNDTGGVVPLALLSVTYVSGTASAFKLDSTRVDVEADGRGSSVFSYVVGDAAGATSTGTLNVTATGTVASCSTGGTNSVAPGTPDVTDTSGDGTGGTTDATGTDPGGGTDPGATGDGGGTTTDTNGTDGASPGRVLR